MDMATRYLNIQAEMCSVTFCLAGLINTLIFMRAPGRQRQTLALCFLSLVTMALGDALNLAFLGRPGALARSLVWLGNVVTFESAAVLTAAFSCHLVYRVGEPPPHGFFRSLKTATHLQVWTLLMRAWPLVAVGIILAGTLFTVDAGSVYHRTALFPFAEDATIAVLAVDLALVVRHRADFGRRACATFAGCAALVIAGCAMSAAIYSLNFGLVAASAAAVVVYAELQREAAERQLAEQVALERAQGDLERAQLQLEQAVCAAAASQIAPHFLGNTLAAVQALCLTDPHEAARCVDLLAGHMSAVAHALDGGELISVEEELDHVGDYLELREATSGGRVRWRLDEGPEGFYVPPLSVLTLVENAVDHGVLPAPGGGTVSVATRDAGACYEVVVADDGVGFVSAPDLPGAAGGPGAPDLLGAPDERGGGRKRLGVANTRLRVERLLSGSLEMSSTPGHGSRATIRIPKHNAKETQR